MLGRLVGSIIYLVASYGIAHSTELSATLQTLLTLGINAALHSAEHYISSKGGK